MNVYCISGICADRSIFKYIRLPEGYTMKHLEWIDPRPDESLSAYASRLAEDINFSAPYSLIGLSLGGIIASEISRQFSPVQTILISSIPSRNDLPDFFKLAATTGFYRLVPTPIFKHASVIKHYFGSESREDRLLLRNMIRKSDTNFIRWAIAAVLHWKSDGLPKPYTHIHGTKDEMFPIRYTKPSHVIKGGNHMLIMNYYQEINRILQEVLV